MNTNLKPVDTPVPLAVLADRLDVIAIAKAELDREAKQIESEVLNRYEIDIAALYKAKSEPFGSVNLTRDDLPLAINIPKKIDWDQAKLATLYSEIKASGCNPDEYMTIEYDVPESKYKAWPSDIVAQFEPARTVTPGKAKLTMKREGAQ